MRDASGGLGHRFGHPGSVGILPTTARRASPRSHGPRGNAVPVAPAARLSHTARRFGGSRVAETMTKAFFRAVSCIGCGRASKQFQKRDVVHWGVVLCAMRLIGVKHEVHCDAALLAKGHIEIAG